MINNDIEFNDNLTRIEFSNDDIKTNKNDFFKNIFAMIGLATIIILILYLLNANFDIINKLIYILSLLKYKITKLIREYIIEDADHIAVFKIYKNKLKCCINRIKTRFV